MPPNNPYIEKVKSDAHIISQADTLYSHAGKWNLYFGNNHPRILEIGTGMGNFFGKIVAERPNANFLGMEIRYKRLFSSAEKARASGNNNFVLLKDFGENIDKIFAPEEIFETYIFFPDPWERKERQRKHRLMQENFLEKLHGITEQGGKLIFKSDHREYFDSTVEILEKQGLWNIEICIHNYESSEFFDMANITSFEAMYRGEAKEIHYFEAKKIKKV